jgi:hypothetical protein
MLQSAAKAAPVQKRNDESGELRSLLYQTGPLVASDEVEADQRHGKLFLADSPFERRTAGAKTQ